MSTPTTLQGKLVPMAIGTDGSTYKNVVCKKTLNLKIDSSVNTEETDCGPLVSLGTVNWSFDWEGIYNTAYAGATEMSANQIFDFVNAQTLVYVKVLHSSDILITGSGYLSSFSEKFDAVGLVSYSCTFTGQGTLTRS